MNSVNIKSVYITSAIYTVLSIYSLVQLYFKQDVSKNKSGDTYLQAYIPSVFYTFFFTVVQMIYNEMPIFGKKFGTYVLPLAFFYNVIGLQSFAIVLFLGFGSIYLGAVFQSVLPTWIIQFIFVFCFRYYNLDMFLNKHLAGNIHSFRYLSAIRCISVVSKINTERNTNGISRKIFARAYRYLCFFPTAIVGPYTPFGRLTPQNNARQFTPFWLILTLTCYFSCLFFVTIMFNFNCTDKMVATNDVWVAWAIIFGLCYNFTMELKFLYGACLFCSSLLGRDVPRDRKCALYTPTFSGLWKILDHGLHLFLKEQIFKPLCLVVKAVVAFLLMWVFIGLWHYTSIDTLYWCSCSSLLLLLEHYLEKLIKKVNINSTFRLYFFEPVLRGFLFFAGLGSSLIFLASYEQSRKLVNIMVSDPGNCFVTFVLMYCHVFIGAFLQTNSK